MFSRSIVASLALLVASVSAKERFNEIKVSLQKKRFRRRSFSFVFVWMIHSFWSDTNPFLSSCITLHTYLCTYHRSEKMPFTTVNVLVLVLTNMFRWVVLLGVCWCRESPSAQFSHFRREFCPGSFLSISTMNPDMIDLTSNLSYSHIYHILSNQSHLPGMILIYSHSSRSFPIPSHGPTSTECRTWPTRWTNTYLNTVVVAGASGAFPL